MRSGVDRACRFEVELPRTKRGKTCRRACINDIDARFADQLHQRVGLRAAEQKLDFYRQVIGQFEKRFFVQYAVSAETGAGTKYRAAAEAMFFGLFQQPLGQQYAVVFGMRVAVEVEVLSPAAMMADSWQCPYINYAIHGNPLISTTRFMAISLCRFTPFITVFTISAAARLRVSVTPRMVIASEPIRCTATWLPNQKYC